MGGPNQSMPGITLLALAIHVKACALKIQRTYPAIHPQKPYSHKIFDQSFPMNRAANLHQLSTEKFDLLVIGGGASGAGCALDAAMRGLKVALVEADDFAAGTSSKSTKLIHGGIRYLEQAIKKLDFGQLRQVRHGLAERRTMLESAPFLARPLELVMPCSSWFERLYFFIGLRIYDLLAGRRNHLPASRWLSKSDILQKFPGLKQAGLTGGVSYFDGQFDDARYALLLAKTAAEHGAIVCNHLKINSFRKNSTGQLEAAEVENRLAGEQFTIAADCFLNCTGPSADRIRRLANEAAEPRLRPSKGAHVLIADCGLPVPLVAGRIADFSQSETRNPQSEIGLLVPKTADGRVVFAIPKMGGLMVGTTDTAWPDDPSGEPFVSGKEADFLLETVNRFLEKPVRVEAVRAGFAGLRPLLSASAKRTTATLLRDHEVEFDEQSGLISLLGGKWTTWRLMGCDAINFVCKKLKINELCPTGELRLAGSEGFSFQEKTVLKTRFHLDDDVADHLLKNYGSCAEQLCEQISGPPFFEKLLPGWPFLKAEIAWQIREEMACTPRDILARRLRLEQTDWRATGEALPVVAEIMAAELGWSAVEKAGQIARYRQVLEEMNSALNDR